MTQATLQLFISDLHLDLERPRITQLFLDFLEDQACSAQVLYILGDLFETWIGDDHQCPLGQDVCKGLAKLSKSGTRIFFMPGNRDFLLGPDYLGMAGAHLLADPCIIRLNDQPVILTHGDLLCTDDVVYQQVRKQLRSEQWQQQFLNQTIEQRQAFATHARQASKQHTGNASAEIMDVNQHEVDRYMSEHRVSMMIHGHTHRPNIHHWQLQNQARQRLVLGDWYEQGSVLSWDGHRFDLRGFN